MKDLNELILEASEIADARKKVFNELTTSIKEKLIPSLVKIMKCYGLSKVFVCTQVKPVKGFKGYPDPQRESTEYGIRINEDGTICEVEYDYMRDGWGHEYDPLGDYQVLKSGAINLASSILKKIEILNNKYQQKNIDAQSLINNINNL